MKRQASDRLNFSSLKSLDEFVRLKGSSIGDIGTQDQWFQDLRKSLQVHLNHEARLHGLRIESVFAHVVAAMGHCTLISEEDSGTYFSSEECLQRPDFRIVTNDSRKMLVEVKNYHPASPMRDYSIQGDYLASLKRYAEVCGIPLWIAIYWSKWNIWTLLDSTRLDATQKVVKIKMTEAFLHNEMHLLGDAMIGTEPPLSFRLYADQNKPRTVQYGAETGFTIKKVCLCSNNREIDDPIERQIAWFLIWNGKWVSSEYIPEIQDGLVNFVELQFQPSDVEDQPIEEIGFRIVGHLSQMVTSECLRSTSGDGSIRSISPSLQVENLGVHIPRDYKGKALPLWRFVTLPIHANCEDYIAEYDSAT